MKTPQTIIEVQDQYIATMMEHTFLESNYYTIQTKTTKKARAAMMNLGLSLSQAEEAIQDAHDLVNLQRGA